MANIIICLARYPGTLGPQGCLLEDSPDSGSNHEQHSGLYDINKQNVISQYKNSNTNSRQILHTSMATTLSYPSLNCAISLFHRFSSLLPTYTELILLTTDNNYIVFNFSSYIIHCLREPKGFKGFSLVKRQFSCISSQLNRINPITTTATATTAPVSPHTALLSSRHSLVAATGDTDQCYAPALSAGAASRLDVPPMSHS